LYFTFPEYVALAAAKVWSGTAALPGRQELWRRYRELYAQRKGYGRHFQYMSPQAIDKVLRFFQGWLNGAAAQYGGRMVSSFAVFFFVERATHTLWALFLCPFFLSA